MTRVESLGKRDVLCTKEGAYSTHEGNLLFRWVIQEHVKYYHASYTKGQKMRITRSVLQTMTREYKCRFVRPCADGSYEELTETATRDKISHALRFAVRKFGQKNRKSLRSQLMASMGASLGDLSERSSSTSLIVTGFSHPSSSSDYASAFAWGSEGGELYKGMRRQNDTVVPPCAEPVLEEVSVQNLKDGPGGDTLCSTFLDSQDIAALFDD
jgi:hypothetical protein